MQPGDRRAGGGLVAPLRIPRFALLGDRPPLTTEERRLVLRVIAVTAIPLATMVLIVGLIGASLIYHELRDRANDNRELIRQNEQAIKEAQDAARASRMLALRLDDERVARTEALERQVYEECVQNENQDETNAALYRKVKAATMAAPPTPERQELIEALDEAIDSREPPGEVDCKPPGSA